MDRSKGKKTVHSDSYSGLDNLFDNLHLKEGENMMNVINKPILTLKEILGLNEPERFKLVYDEIVAEKLLLYEILKALKGQTAEDVLIRVPESDNIYLEQGKTYEKEYQVNRNLTYIAYDIPDGLFLILYKDGNPYYWASGEIGALELRNGVKFGTVRIRVVNNSSVSQKWSCTMIFV